MVIGIVPLMLGDLMNATNMHRSLNYFQFYFKAVCSQKQFLRSKIFISSSSTSRNCCLFSFICRPTKFICQQKRPLVFSSLTRLCFRKKAFYPHLCRKYSTGLAKENAKKINKYSRSEIQRLIDLMKPEKWKLIGAISVLIISSSITMAVPFSLGRVIDVIYSTDHIKMKENLKKLTLILVGLFIVGGLCNFGRVYLISIAGQRITRNLRQKVFRSLLNQEVAFFDKSKTGEFVNRLALDTSIVCDGLTKNISDGLRSLIMVLSGVSMMFYMSPELAAVGLSIVPPVAALAVLYGRFVKRINKEVQDSLASAASVAEEKISNIRTVKAFTNEKREVEAYEDKLSHVLRLTYKQGLANGVFFGLTGLSGNVIILSILYYGGLLVSENLMTIGNLTSFLMYAAYIGVSINGLSNFYTQLNRSLGASIRLWEIIDRVPRIPVSGGVVPQLDPKGFITFDNVTFSYPTRKGEPILKNLNLDIPQAAVTALVGSSGSGKSTVALILLRLYDPDEGNIFLDGNNICDLSPHWYRSHIGFVSQEPVLFSGTIRENILYGASDPSSVTEEDMIQAAKEANCFNFITSFEQGFEAKVGERGILLSGGQKQRIAIARALIKNPRILLLDEATSALDSESEHLVQEALAKIMKGRTVLVIAHRLSTIKNADQIVVLDKGKVVEKGTYAELMSRNKGAFKKLIKYQAFSLDDTPTSERVSQ